MAAYRFKRCRFRPHLVRNFLSVDAPSSLSTEALRTASGTSTSCSSEPSISAWLTGPRGGHWVEPKMYQKWPVLNTGLEDGSFMKLRGHDAAVTWLFLGGGEGNSCDTHCVCMSFVWLICFFTIGYNNFKCQDCGTMNQEIHAYLCGIVVFNWLRPFILRPPLLHKVPGLTLDALDWEARWWDLSCFIKKIRVEVGHYLNTNNNES